MHHMNVKTKYYRLLKSGKKTIELRLFDEKRQKIKQGDVICFSDSACPTDTFQAKVVQLHRAAGFKELCRNIKPCQAGFDTEKELLCVLEEFYTPAAQQQFGVLGIEIEVI